MFSCSFLLLNVHEAQRNLAALNCRSGWCFWLSIGLAWVWDVGLGCWIGVEAFGAIPAGHILYGSLVWGNHNVLSFFT